MSSSSPSSSSSSSVAEKDAGSNKEEQEQPLPDAEPGPSNAASSSNAGHGDIPNPPRIPDVVRLGDTNAFFKFNVWLYVHRCQYNVLSALCKKSGVDCSTLSEEQVAKLGNEFVVLYDILWESLMRHHLEIEDDTFFP